MLPRNLNESEFKRLTVENYMGADYCLSREDAMELADWEWQIRQEVESMRHMPTAELKSSNPRPGFGLRGVWIKSVERPEPKARVSKNKVFIVNREILLTLRHKRVLSPTDICSLMSGDKEFLPCYARALDFPAYEVKAGGYVCWKVYDWIMKHQRAMKIKAKLGDRGHD